MKLSELLFFGVLAWAGIGVAGIAISLLRRRRAEARRHTAWLAAVLGAYMVTLLTVSALQPTAFIPLGKDQCYNDMCFAVIDATEGPGLVSGERSRAIRVSVRVTNTGRSARSEPLIRAYLFDCRGRIYQPLPGLSGNPLTARVGPGSQMISEPIFRVPAEAAGLGLVFTHGHWQPGRLILGDPDSIGHKPAVVLLGR
jgi:hypothetical protein